MDVSDAIGKEGAENVADAVRGVPHCDSDGLFASTPPHLAQSDEGGCYHPERSTLGLVKGQGRGQSLTNSCFKQSQKETGNQQTSKIVRRYHCRKRNPPKQDNRGHELAKG